MERRATDVPAGDEVTVGILWALVARTSWRHGVLLSAFRQQFPIRRPISGSGRRQGRSDQGTGENSERKKPPGGTVLANDSRENADDHLGTGNTPTNAAYTTNIGRPHHGRFGSGGWLNASHVTAMPCVHCCTVNSRTPPVSSGLPRGAPYSRLCGIPKWKISV